MWKVHKENAFESQVKRLDPQIQERVNDAINELRDSVLPARLGEYKRSMRDYTYEIERKYRLVYNFEYIEKTIIVYRVCDHKSVYIRD